MKNIIFSLKIVFKDSLYIFLALSLTLNLLALYYFLFSEVTTFKVFFEKNTAFYNWTSIILTIISALFFGIAISLLVWQVREKKGTEPSQFGNNVIASFLGALSIGCPVCSALLASVLGISGGLAAFPFQGLEVKMISIFLFILAIFSSSQIISRKSEVIAQVADERSNKSKNLFSKILPAFLGFFFLFLVAYLPLIADELNFAVSFQKTKSEDGSAIKNPAITGADSSAILQKINPAQGYTINATYGDIGPKLLAAGAIDLEKMKTLYEKAGQPLTQEQLKILTQGSDEKIKITPENSYFLLNFLWALGLANKNAILDEGPIMKYGKDKVGNFASTGGWTLGKKEATKLFSNSEIIKLNSNQQKILEDFAFNSYRPCCSNPTGFPDCNHGIAALALGEIMASQGASADEIFNAFKYVNGFWFPQTYFDIATYFEAKEGKEWNQVDGRLVAGKDYSTPQGWNQVRNWLKTNNILEEPPSGGGGCGV